ncbi:efflux RND transporter periplasmic adaptor subunit [Methylocystis heyeri]|uniref:Efflux RND transporter periplasmic adaptor subunit n=1 Tax=Methylocystis heyeri TaxID=391905 RepID=A0A6B8KEU5_9HYPH|nr:efflux RND transporter periplasmic adaptor subunit [Methylocystis heyeri]QGM45525.1 efflux RND transporter periplasmic adaptor subunit [Methylocystis heyeri]
MKFPQNRRFLIAAGAVAALAVAVGGWRFAHPPSREDAASSHRGRRHGDAAEVVPVTVASARVEDVPVTIDAVGTVQALNTATIRTQVDGRLVKLPFNEGEDVKKGDVVALIEPDLYKAQYDQAVAKKAQDEATLANARVDLVRYKKLTVGNYGSQQQYDTQKALVAQLEAQVRADQAAIDSAKTTLGYTTIASPIDGRTGIRLVDVGNILHASDATGILVITQLKPIYVIFTIPQQALPAVQRAQEKGIPHVTALGPDNAAVIETGEVSVIDNQIDQATGTARIKATFANPTLHLWPGQFVNVRLTVDTVKNAIVTPSTAIQRGPSGAFVYVLGNDGQAVMTPVVTGQQDENIAVIVKGLDKDAQVITTGFARLSNGSPVHVVSTVETGSPASSAPARASDDGSARSWSGAKGSGGGERGRHRRGGDAPAPGAQHSETQPADGGGGDAPSTAGAQAK